MILNGFFINVKLTTEAVLSVELDASNLSWSDYKNVITELEDIMHEIDLKYSVKPKLVKGRAIHSKHRRIKQDVRKKTISFEPFPSRYTTILKNLRSYIYKVLIPSYCFVIEEVGHKKVYFLPKARAPALLEALDDINKNVLSKLRKEVEEFRKSNEYFSIISLLKKYNLDTSKIEYGSFYIGDFTVVVTPVDFGYSVDEDELYRTREMQKHIRGLSILKKSIERKQREYASMLVKDILSRVQTVLAGEGYVKFRNKALIKKWIDLCNSVGLTEFTDKILNPLMQVLSEKQKNRKAKAVEIFGTENISEAIVERAKSILP